MIQYYLLPVYNFTPALTKSKVPLGSLSFLIAAYFSNFGAESNIFQHLCCFLQSDSMSNHSGKHVAAI